MGKISKAQKGGYYNLRPDRPTKADKEREAGLVKMLETKGDTAKKAAPKKPTTAAPKKKMKSGGKQMLKRADGSYSQRGLWDNIRAAAKRNKAAGRPGKKPTAAMLKQERRIKAKSKK